MLHVFEQPQLSVSPLSEDLRLKRTVELLDGHFLFGLLVYGGAVGRRRSLRDSALQVHHRFGPQRSEGRRQSSSVTGCLSAVVLDSCVSEWRAAACGQGSSAHMGTIDADEVAPLQLTGVVAFGEIIINGRSGAIFNLTFDGSRLWFRC